MDEQAKLSRRSMLRGVALLAGGTVAAGVIQVKPAYAQKAGKEAVKYRIRIRRRMGRNAAIACIFRRRAVAP